VVSQGDEQARSALAKPHSVRLEPLAVELVRQVLLFHQERVVIQVAKAYLEVGIPSWARRLCYTSALQALLPLHRHAILAT